MFGCSESATACCNHTDRHAAIVSSLTTVKQHASWQGRKASGKSTLCNAMRQRSGVVREQPKLRRPNIWLACFGWHTPAPKLMAVPTTPACKHMAVHVFHIRFGSPAQAPAGAAYLDMLGLQFIHGLLILLCHMARCWPAHKVLPCAAQPILKAWLPDRVFLPGAPVASHRPLPDACIPLHSCSITAKNAAAPSCSAGLTVNWC